jgi:hypothetical protein
MSRLPSFLSVLFVTGVFPLTSVAQSAPSAASASRTLKEKIVFVRADPSTGLVSL